ncbi:rhodanese-like domain-containing protein [Puerhibacterium puerhi]|uniref:rhodanese-like domain-containing protein n=1 Tax=Puerhibacterium puerhi TaxID=2692623 RepID=UPI001358C181|nr:rhodanese-like domain-containing protein [Puerhibacterium puerhi]
MSTESRAADGYTGDITPEQAWQLLADDPGAVLVDVRTEDEWRRVGVPDVAATGRPAVFAQWVLADGTPNPTFLADLRAALARVGADRPSALVLLCRSGQRSVAAARLASAAGLGPAYNVLTGFEGAPGPDGVRDREGWKVAGLPWRATWDGRAVVVPEPAA